MSVIVPVFNAESTLEQALRSAAASTYERIEIIVVDDGSTDSSSVIAMKFAEADGRVRLHRQRNAGPSAAFNSGFTLARGDYVARLDADDLWHPSKLEAQMQLFRQQPELALVFSYIRYIDAQNRVITNGPRQRFPQRALCRGLYESVVGGGSSALMKRAAVDAAGRCDEAFTAWEDLLLQLAISERHPIGFVPQYLVAYRKGSSSLSSDPARMLRTWRDVLRLVEDRFPAISRPVRDWSHAQRCMMFAEAFAWRGQYARSATLLLEALRRDPAWVWRFLAFRINRSVRRTHPAVEVSESVGPDFFDCDPHELVAAEACDAGPHAARLREFQQRRLEIIAKLDVELAQCRTLGTTQA